MYRSFASRFHSRSGAGRWSPSPDLPSNSSRHFFGRSADIRLGHIIGAEHIPRRHLFSCCRLGAATLHSRGSRDFTESSVRPPSQFLF